MGLTVVAVKSLNSAELAHDLPILPSSFFLTSFFFGPRTTTAFVVACSEGRIYLRQTGLQPTKTTYSLYLVVVAGAGFEPTTYGL
jgi:hypothetical protein